MTTSRAFDGSVVPTYLPRLACGGVPVFDNESGMSYRCDSCFAVIGSIGQSNECKTINAQAEKYPTPKNQLKD